MKNKLLLAGTLSAVFFACVETTSAQTDGAAIIKAGKEDANLIMNAYMKPLMKGFSSGLNTGWYNTAKPHGTGGFDITMSFGIFNAPSEDQSYKFSELGVGSSGTYIFTPKPGTDTDPNTSSPSVLGEDKEGGTYNMNYRFTSPLTGNDTFATVGEVSLPQGIGSSMMLSLPPAAQVAIGIYKNTEVMIRFLPTLNFGDGKAGMFGFGVKHDIKQWIPGIKEQKIWDWSVALGYTSYSAEIGIKQDVSGDDYKQAINHAQYDAKYANYDGQKFTFDGSGWMLGTIVSAKFGPLTPYLGINYNRATTEFKMVGDYPLLVAETNYDPANPATAANLGKPKIVEISDPLTLSGSVSGLRINPGVRLKLLLLTLHYDYSLNTYGYNLHTIGVGLNLQSIVPFKL